MFFESWDDVKRYIQNVCFDDYVDTYNRWRFFDHNQIFGKINEK